MRQRSDKLMATTPHRSSGDKLLIQLRSSSGARSPIFLKLDRKPLRSSPARSAILAIQWGIAPKGSASYDVLVRLEQPDKGSSCLNLKVTSCRRFGPALNVPD
jgi:hypothetical protein